MEETNQGIEILVMIDIITMLIALVVMFYHIFKKLSEINKDKYYDETQQYNHIIAIILLTGTVALINLIEGDFIYTFIWGIQSSIWYYNLKTTRKQFNDKRKEFQAKQDIDFFEKKPTEFTRKKSISEQLDDMLEETKKEN